MATTIEKLETDDRFETKAAPPRWLSIWLIVLAALKTWSALTDLPAVLFDYGHTETKLVVAQAITSGRLVLAPLFAATALYLAVRDRLAGAIMVLAGLILVQWLSDVPDIFIHGWEVSPTVGGATVLAGFVLFPVLALAALACAARARQLALAAALVSIPTLVSGILVAGFAISVAIHGF